MNVLDEIRLLFAELQILAEGMNARLTKIEPRHVDHQEDIDDIERRLECFVSELQWHPIEKGLPQVNDQGYREVIITDGEERSVGIYLEGRDYISSVANSTVKRSEITHWMYYPPIPDDA